MSSIVHDPEEFKRQFAGLVSSFGGFLAAASTARETSTDDDDYCFALASRLERPTEFLQSLLDLLRVTFEPRPLGTMQLNSNWDFVYAAVPDRPFRLGYLSVLSEPGESVPDFVQGPLRRRMEHLGYGFGEAIASFVSVCVGADLYTLRMNADVLRTFGAGFRVDEVLAAIQEQARGEDGAMPASHAIHAGLSLDEGLATGRIRCSCWLLLPLPSHH